MSNVVVEGITSNTKMKGAPLTKKEDSVIKLNYLLTISEDTVHKTLFRIGKQKRKLVLDILRKRLYGLVC